MSRSFQQFLESKSQDGQFDSTAGFMVDAERALAKLSAYALAGKADWLIKLVQASVAGKAKSLQIVQHRKQVLIHFELKVLPTVGLFRKALLNPSLEAGPFLQELNLSLRSLMAEHPLVFRFDEAGSRKTLGWDKEHLRDQGLSRIDSELTRFTVAVIGPHTSAELADQALALQRRAVFSPVPVTLDGRALDPSSIQPFSAAGHTLQGSPRNLALVEFTTSLEELGEPMESASGWLNDALRSKRPFLHWPSDTPPTHCLGLWLSHGPVPGSESSAQACTDDCFRLLWTRLGAVCAVQQLESCKLGGFLQLPGDGFRSDLVGLNLSLPESATKDACAVLAQAEQLLSILRERVMVHQPHFMWEDGKEIVFNTLAGGFMGLTSCSVVGTLGLFLVPVGAAIVAYSSDLDSPELLQQFPQRIQEFGHQLQDLADAEWHERPVIQV